MTKQLSTSDVLLLQVLTKMGAYTFPLVTDQKDDKATIHAESLVRRGLAARLQPSSSAGTTYKVTEDGRSALVEYEKQRNLGSS